MHSLTNERVISVVSVKTLTTFSVRGRILKLKIYEIDAKYLAYMKSYAEHIFYDSKDKSSRKYIGIILEIEGVKYFAPLSSFKNKHKKMDEGVDFIKIKDYAVININNMIPVPEGCYHLVDVNGEKDPHYKYLLQAEAREINRQKNRIVKNAGIVRSHKIAKENTTSLGKRCNDFISLESACNNYRK